MTEIFDRGNKKWTSIMIPELREELKLLFQEEVVERPELDEQEIERLNRLLMAAYREGRVVRIRYWEDGECEVCGRIVMVGDGLIRIKNEEGKVNVIDKPIIGVSLA